MCVHVNARVCVGVCACVRVCVCVCEQEYINLLSVQLFITLNDLFILLVLTVTVFSMFLLFSVMSFLLVRLLHWLWFGLWLVV